MATSGSLGISADLCNEGWWDPGGFLYVNSPARFESRMNTPSVDAGRGIYRIDLYAEMGDLGDGIDFYASLGKGLACFTGPILTGGRLYGCGVNEFGGAAACGMRYVATWQVPTTSPQLFIGAADWADLRVSARPSTAGNQQHYLYGSRFRLDWYSAIAAKRRQSPIGG